jgi:hypothetical protein
MTTMARGHAQEFANRALARAVYADPLALSRAIAAGTASQLLASVWEQAGADLAPIERAPAGTFAATLVHRGMYAIAMVLPPAPRVSGDPAAIALIGRGDGVDKLSTIAYYVLELRLDPRTGAASFTLSAPTATNERAASLGDAPLPDPNWFADHAFELYLGKKPEPPVGIPDLPGWFWWHAFDGANALRTFNEQSSDSDRIDAIRTAPILMLPEMVELAEVFSGEPSARRLGELRAELRKDPKHAAIWQALAHRLTSTNVGSPPASALRALPLIAEAAEHGALTTAQAQTAEASVRSRLAQLGVDPEHNAALAAELNAAAEREPRLARSSDAPPIFTEDPVWRPLFLDETDLPRCNRGDHDEAASEEPAFLAAGGLRAGYVAWIGDERSSMAGIVDTRWVFRSPAGAIHYWNAHAPLLGDGMPMLQAPQLGDKALVFGDEMTRARRTYVIVVRIGRVIARLHAREGAYAAASQQVLHAALLHPLAEKIVQRARRGLAAYWLGVAAPTNAVPALFHSPGFDAARLLGKYPLLAHAELPVALAISDDKYKQLAHSLASFQAQLRAHRWATYRESMLALVRHLLATDMGDPRVNAAHAWEIVTELRYLDPDPIWIELEAACLARG